MNAAIAEVKSYVNPGLNLMMMIGAVLAMPGALYVYSKLQNNDPGFKGALSTFIGSMIFLVVVPAIIKGFFGL